ncbi:hypothetical protein RCL1_003119 [Eukaryota sp. TZLM3-RCL]
MPLTTRCSSRASHSVDSTIPIHSSAPKKHQVRKSKLDISSQETPSQIARGSSQENESSSRDFHQEPIFPSFPSQEQDPQHEQQVHQEPPILHRPKICPGSKSIYLDYIDPTKVQGQSGTYIYRPRPLLEDAPKVGQFQSRIKFDRAYSKWKARQDSVRNFFRNVDAPHHRVNVCPGLFMAIPDKNKTIRIFGDLETFIELLKPDTVVSTGDGDFSLKHDSTKSSYHPMEEITSVLTSLITENP